MSEIQAQTPVVADVAPKVESELSASKPEIESAVTTEALKDEAPIDTPATTTIKATETEAKAPVTDAEASEAQADAEVAPVKKQSFIKKITASFKKLLKSVAK